MPRRPEIGNVQLYPSRPLKPSDRNGYVLKFYCPLLRKRVRKNCGTRDRREARRILRECRERLLNGEYVASGGAITAKHVASTGTRVVPHPGSQSAGGKTWQECYERYREHRKTRVRESSLTHALSRLNIAERIFEGYREDHGLPEGLLVSEVMTLDMLEYLQDRLLAGDECRYDSRSPNTVNSMMGAVMAFVRFCHARDWIDKVPPVQKLDADAVMKGRPITGEEFERMLEATPKVVGERSAESWRFSLRILWESGFRVGDLMDFTWDDDRHIHPVWPSRPGQHPTIIVPSSQKNGKTQEIPMLPGLEELLRSLPKRRRSGWVVKPDPIHQPSRPHATRFRPLDADLRNLARRFSNCSIAKACGVSETAVRNWLNQAGIVRDSRRSFDTDVMVPAEIIAIRKRAELPPPDTADRPPSRLTKEHVGRVIALIGKEAAIVVHQPDPRTGRREKYASAHDLRRGCARRLINAGVSAETLKVVFRHSSFATTEKFYAASRSAQAAATELAEKLTRAHLSAISGGINGGKEGSLQFSAEDVSKLRTCPVFTPCFTIAVNGCRNSFP